MRTVAIIGPTASGKTAIAHRVARQSGAVLLSCDTLSVFCGIDIASAKPTLKERAGLDYFGLDCVPPDGSFSAEDFIEEFKRARRFAAAANRPLIIVGGSGFYLKALLSGLSPLPPLSAALKREVATQLEDLPSAYALLEACDPDYASRIAPSDRYRIEKGLLIAKSTGAKPSEWFEAHPAQPTIEKIALFEVYWPVKALRERIFQRTETMLQEGLIEEVCTLECCTPRSAQAMRAIGIVEVLAYLDGQLKRQQLGEQIATHTAQLAKRQRTFNRGQFHGLRSLEPCACALEEALKDAILRPSD